VLDKPRKISVISPGKLMLLGEHAAVYGYPCLAAAIDTKFVVTVKLRKDIKIVIRSDLFKEIIIDGISEINSSMLIKQSAYLASAIKTITPLLPVKSGFNLDIKSTFSANYGLGSSAAATAASISALARLYQLHLTKGELFDMSFESIKSVDGLASGFDLAAVINGGIIYYKKGSLTEKLTARPELVICYSGRKADTTAMIRQVSLKMKKDRKAVIKIFQKISQLVINARQSLMMNDLPEAGKLMNLNQDFLEDLGVSTPKLNKLIGSARKAGAYGAKISGAGGGDCLIALVDKQNREAVKKALFSAGGEIIPAKITLEGVKETIL